MISAQEALVPMLLSEVRDIVFANRGACDIRGEGDEIVLTVGSITVKCDIPEIDNIFIDARKCAIILQSRLDAIEAGDTL